MGTRAVSWTGAAAGLMSARHVRYSAYPKRYAKMLMFRKIIATRNRAKKPNYIWFIKTFIGMSNGIELLMLPIAVYKYRRKFN